MPLAVAGALLVCAGAAYGSDSFLTPLGSVADAERQHLIRVVAVTMIAIVPVLIGVPLILWRYRRGRSEAAYRPDWQFSRLLETLMWGVPIAIITVLGVWLWQSTHQLDPYRSLGANALEIDVIGLDWKWLFIYPEQGIASVGEMAMPVGRPVTLHLTTDSVMQSFWIPALAGQIYAMPGMESRLNLIADRPGTAQGKNTQYNGRGFAGQTFAARALDGPDWEAWVAAAKHSRIALDTAGYRVLARRGTLDDARRALAPDQMTDPLLFGSIEPGLFERVVRRYRGTRPIHPEQQPGAPAYDTGGAHD